MLEKTLKELEEFLREDGRFSESQIEALLRYSHLVLETNQHLNLTAITDSEGFYTKHILDSLSLLKFIDAMAKKAETKAISFLDIGSGAGFPGIPLKTMRPELKLVMLDSLNKRVKFLKEVIQDLNLDNTKAIHARAEDLAHQAEYRENFDLVSARAVAKLPVLVEYALPYLKKDGLFLAMKTSSDELKSSQKALNILGGKYLKTYNFNLPLDSGERSIIVIQKQNKSPKKYPRQAGIPNKQPLK